MMTFIIVRDIFPLKAKKTYFQGKKYISISGNDYISIKGQKYISIINPLETIFKKPASTSSMCILPESGEETQF